MNRQDRETVDLIDAVVREIATLTPQNPADVAANSTNLRIATSASRLVTRAIAAVRQGDHTAARQHLAEAGRIVALPPTVVELDHEIDCCTYAAGRRTRGGPDHCGLCGKPFEMQDSRHRVNDAPTRDT